MTDRELVLHARTELPTLEFDIWFAHHYRHLGRRAGSLALGVTEETFRYRLAVANRKIAAIIAQHKETA